MTVSGLPLHPLLVHAVVVLMPLTAIAAVLHAVWPVAARRLGVVTPLAALVVLVLTPITKEAGEALQRQLGIGVAQHAAYGDRLVIWAIGLFVVAVAVWLFHGPVLASRREAMAAGTVTGIRVGLAVVTVVVAVGSIVWVFLTGDSGARAVWGAATGS
ncbi:polyferredoxin [Friedmanniella endophytica]|uniref:Polyferredoxin n=1 Tax=Microlunatus kandeliicorticis TaxID=1759536 RepID=A0A7W3ITV3_9ACTN|nr:DUF2231 domain-containing protein [Microlunatus kandeliicorticis]MBA8795172.1 polyferredoxin [Microlunatus kandeliicorticis]